MSFICIERIWWDSAMRQRNDCLFEAHMEGSTQLPRESRSGCMCLTSPVESKYFHSSAKQELLRLIKHVFLHVTFGAWPKVTSLMLPTSITETVTGASTACPRPGLSPVITTAGVEQWFWYLQWKSWELLKDLGLHSFKSEIGFTSDNINL